MAAAAELAFGEDLALDLVAVFFEHLHLDSAIVDQNDVAEIDVVDEVLVIDVNRTYLLAAFAANRERELLARLEVKRHAKFTGANRRPLGIHHNADEPLPAGRGFADILYHAPGPIMRRVRHVQAENIHAGID